MGEFFSAQDYGRPVYKHNNLPVYLVDQFNFYRCLEFREEFYGKTASELHAGNLRKCNGRYSKLFPGQQISYWADSPKTARAEIKKHGSSKNILTFWAYDDATSTFPIFPNREPLRVIDGRVFGIEALIDKVEADIPLADSEKNLMQDIMALNPDCLAFSSHACKGGENYIFLERGFQKLALREVRLRLGNRPAGNRTRIVCADSSDYSPRIKSYGEYFAPIARVSMRQEYLQTDEYKSRNKVLEKSFERIRRAYNK